MERLRFLVNDRIVETEAWPGSPALDFIRRELGLTGTKEGCREGDCGACAVILGERIAEGGERKNSAEFRFRAVPSCLLALGELDGRQLITIEGLTAAGEAKGLEGFTPVQMAFLEENASQCGFCSPGFIVSLSAWLLEGERLDEEGAIVAVEGNLCRCTGYGSIRRAAARLIERFGKLPSDPLARLEALVAAGVVPESLTAFARGELMPIAGESTAKGDVSRLTDGDKPALLLGGGTDYYVRDTDPSPRPALFLDRIPRFTGIRREGDLIEIGAAMTIRDFFESRSIRASFPGIERFERSFASILVRNRATLGGNVANASPVADMTSILMALGARARIFDMRESMAENDAWRREIALEKLYVGYKKLDLTPGEVIGAFALPVGPGILLNFEKASKRASLDIAAANSAMRLELIGDRMTRVRVSAGGVAATPLLLGKTSALLEGKRPSAALALEASRAAASEVKPIGDVRGSADYRSRALSRLILAHFATLFPAVDIAMLLSEEAKS